MSAMILSALLTGCGNEDKGSGTGHMYDAVLCGNPASLDPQFAYDPASNTVIKNLYSGLMTVDAGGNIVCCNAESYTVSDDGTGYTGNYVRVRCDGACGDTVHVRLAAREGTTAIGVKE